MYTNVVYEDSARFCLSDAIYGIRGYGLRHRGS
jgi:hypothetical protein